MAQIRLPSGEVRARTSSTAGPPSVRSATSSMRTSSSARPARPATSVSVRTVRGSVMNPVDHPHGGGEGRSPIGRPSPVTPWGKPTLGYKTRNKKARTDKFIVKRRNDK